MIRPVIVGTGSYIPTERVENSAFMSHDFWGADGKRIDKTNQEIVDQFQAITGIRERRYVTDQQVTSDIAYEAARDALDTRAGGCVHDGRSRMRPRGLTEGSMMRAGDIKRAMVIGAETLSRVSDPHDRDSLIYSDGAGATIIEARETDEPVGILAHAVRSDTLEHSNMLNMGKTYNEDVFVESIFLKMEGRKVYRYAVSTVAAS